MKQWDISKNKQIHEIGKNYYKLILEDGEDVYFFNNLAKISKNEETMCIYFNNEPIYLYDRKILLEVWKEIQNNLNME